MVFALLFGGMTARMVKLFGDIVATRNENGKLVVMKGEQRLSPYEYDEVLQLTSKCWALYRGEPQRCDLVFSSGVWHFDFQLVFELAKMGRGNQRTLIGGVVRGGIEIFDEAGHFRAFIPGFNQVAIAEDRFLVVVKDAFVDAYVKVYDLFGELLAEDYLDKALERARLAVGLPAKISWHDICNVSRMYGDVE